MSTKDQITAREGDVLVVAYGEVKLPLTSRFGSITVGGLIYTRQLVDCDDVETEYQRIYDFLKRLAERDAREKVKAWNAEMTLARRVADESARANLPPKPEVRR